VLVDAVMKHELHEVGDLLYEFWGMMAPMHTSLFSDRHIIDIIVRCDICTFDVCYAMQCVVAQRIHTHPAYTQQMMAVQLVPDALTQMKSSEVKDIRSFSKNLVPWVSNAFRQLGPSAATLYSHKFKVCVLPLL
jgi:hypothetical protein